MMNESNNNSVPLDTILPHGGQLVNRMLRGEMRQAVQERAEQLPKIDLNNMNLSDLELISNGAMSPLTGFMGRADYERVVGEMRLSNNLLWSIPVSLPVSDDVAATIEIGQEIALFNVDGEYHAVGGTTPSVKRAGN